MLVRRLLHPVLLPVVGKHTTYTCFRCEGESKYRSEHQRKTLAAPAPIDRYITAVAPTNDIAFLTNTQEGAC